MNFFFQSPQQQGQTSNNSNNSNNQPYQQQQNYNQQQQFFPQQQQPQQQQQQNYQTSSQSTNQFFQGFGDFFNQQFSQFPQIFGNQPPQQQQQRQPNSNSNQSSYSFSQQQQYPPQSQQQMHHERRPTYHNTRQASRQQERKKNSQNPESESAQKNQQKMNQDPSPDSSIYWKIKGNNAFKQNNIQQALQMYSKAIEIDGSISLYFSNRGRCHKILGDVAAALKDSIQAIELDETNIKAYLLCGQCMAHLSKFENTQVSIDKLNNAIKKMTKALTLNDHKGGEKGKLYQKDLSIYIMRAKKLLWYKQFEYIKSEKKKFIQDFEKSLESESDPEIKQLKFKQFISIVGDPDGQIQFQIPDYLCCHITLDLMEDPVTIESGFTYERAIIEEHLQKNGNTDPVTRKPISGQMFPNLNIKKGVEDFLANNPWAFEYQYNENYMDIIF